MSENIKNYQITIVVIISIIMSSSRAQRPPYAGSRPANGLNQKDKYNTITPSNLSIEDRFGSPSIPFLTNKIPLGQPQKPPVGYPVVSPEPVFTALKPPRPTAANNAATGVVFEDRFGDGNTNTITSFSDSSSSTSSTQRSAVPLDAHGDQLLIDQLNRFPIDKRPFWFINYQAIEAQRNGTVANIAAAQNPKGSFSG